MLTRAGFYKLFKEHVDEICHARLGDKFPSEGVGKNWTDRFLEKYSDHLKTYTARPLEEVRSRAVNPVTNKAWYDLLEEILENGDDRKPIAQECCWGVDEAGFQPQIGAQAERASLSQSVQMGLRYPRLSSCIEF